MYHDPNGSAAEPTHPKTSPEPLPPAPTVTRTPTLNDATNPNRISDANERRNVIYVLTHNHFARTDAETWADGWRGHTNTPTVVLHQANLYDEYGFTIPEALDWHQRGFTADEALAWKVGGWQAAQVIDLMSVVTHFSDIDEWLFLEIPATRALALAKAGVSPFEYPFFEETDDETLAAMCGLLGHVA